MRRVFATMAAAVVGLASGGCVGGGAGGGCLPGATVPCTCPDERSGQAVCNATGLLPACTCSGAMVDAAISFADAIAGDASPTGGAGGGPRVGGASGGGDPPTGGVGGGHSPDGGTGGDNRPDSGTGGGGVFGGSGGGSPTGGTGGTGGGEPLGPDDWRDVMTCGESCDVLAQCAAAECFNIDRADTPQVVAGCLEMCNIVPILPPLVSQAESCATMVDAFVMFPIPVPVPFECER